MSIFTALFHSRDKPQNRTSGSSYGFYFGGTTSGKAVTERTAMQMTAVYSCVRILAEAVAGLPLNIYKYDADGGKVRGPEVEKIMAGLKDKRGFIDKDRLDLSERQAVEYWMKRWGVTRDQIAAAHRKVGRMTKDIAAELGKKR